MTPVCILINYFDAISSHGVNFFVSQYLQRMLMNRHEWDQYTRRWRVHLTQYFIQSKQDIRLLIVSYETWHICIYVRNPKVVTTT